MCVFECVCVCLSVCVCLYLDVCMGGGDLQRLETGTYGPV